MWIILIIKKKNCRKQRRRIVENKETINWMEIRCIYIQGIYDEDGFEKIKIQHF